MTTVLKEKQNTEELPPFAQDAGLESTAKDIDTAINKRAAVSSGGSPQNTVKTTAAPPSKKPLQRNSDGKFTKKSPTQKDAVKTVEPPSPSHETWADAASQMPDDQEEVAVDDEDEDEDGREERTVQTGEEAGVVLVNILENIGIAVVGDDAKMMAGEKSEINKAANAVCGDREVGPWTYLALSTTGWVGRVFTTLKLKARKARQTLQQEVQKNAHTSSTHRGNGTGQNTNAQPNHQQAATDQSQEHYQV